MSLMTSVLRRVANAPDERCTFRAEDLRMSEDGFQHVVEIVQEAGALGYFKFVMPPHRSSRTGLFDLIAVEGLTLDGERALETASD